MQVFEAKDWEALMVRSILPKLAWALSDALVINPADQDLTPWHWFTAWAPVLPLGPMVSLLEAHFFPRWHDVLRAWLMQVSTTLDHPYLVPCSQTRLTASDGCLLLSGL